MRTILLLSMICSLLFPAMAQEGVLQQVKGAAKNKLESQDFNSSRSNKERSNLKSDKKSAAPPASSAPAPPPPADSTSGERIAPAPSEGGVNYKDSYTFDHYVKYDMSKAGSGKISMISYYGSDATMVSMDVNPNMVMISDLENKASIMINEEDKTAIVQSSEMMGLDVANQPKKDVTVTKTGQKKQILGYNCEEYVLTGSDNKKYVVLWITTEAGFSHKLLEAMSQGITITGTATIPENALVLEMISEDDTHMLITEFNEVTTTKSLEGYKVTLY